MDFVNAIAGNLPIEFTQGDTYTYRVAFGDSELVRFLSKMVFTCKYYGIEKEFERTTDESGNVFFSVRLEDTESMCPMITSYDVTVYFTDGTVENVLSETGIRFTVREKKNPVSEV